MQVERGRAMAENGTSLEWRRGDSAEVAAANAATARRLDELISAGERERVVAALETWAPSDILDCFLALRTKNAQKMLRWLSDDLSLRVLSEVDPRFNHALFAEATRAKFAKLLGRLTLDRAKRLLVTLPTRLALELADSHPQAERLREILVDNDSAEAAMKHGAVVARDTETVHDVIEDIRRRSDRIERIDSLHVVDAEGRLVGYMKLRDLILNHGRTPVSEVMRRDPPAVARDTDQEDVLDLAKAQGETVIAVVDEAHRLLGVIAPRELTEIARREAREDIMLMGSVSPESTGFDSPGQIVRRRLPWLLTGLAGALVTALVVGAYEETLTQAAILASFIPVVSATAGNASMQASTVTIQALSEHGKLTGGFAARLGREVAGAAMNGVAMGLAVGLLLFAVSFAVPIERAPALVATVAMSQVLVILVAGTVGTVVPVALARAKVDPAVAMGIFILTLNDVAGVLILFAIATQLYL